jgi:hypothetical protein
MLAEGQERAAQLAVQHNGHHNKLAYCDFTQRTHR